MGRLFAALAVASTCFFLACNTKPDTGVPDAPPPEDSVTLEVRLSENQFQVTNDLGSGSATISVFAVAPDGSETDVTADVTLTVEPAGIGAVAAATLTPTGNVAGLGKVVAFDGAHSGTANFEVFISKILPGTADEADIPLFESAVDDTAHAIAVVYPPNGALIPPNLGEMEIHWTDANAKNVYEIALTGTYVDLKMYVNALGTSNWRLLAAENWALLSSGSRGVELTITVRGINTASPATFVKGSTMLRIAAAEVLGGVYYWNTVEKAIMRHDMATPEMAAERFYPPAGQTGCVGCHAVSRDGTMVVYRREGGNMNTGNLVEADSPATDRIPNDGRQWNFASIHPNNQDMFTTTQSGLSRTDIATGVVTPLYTASRVSHPDTSPNGNYIAGTTFPSGSEVYANEGRIVIFDYDQDTKTVGAPRVLVDPPGGGETAFYPSISPDNEWVLYNRAPNGDSYDNQYAELWVTKLDGTGEPVRLSQADTPNNAFNSWPKWTPFTTMEPTLEGGFEPVMWFTVASRRPFGVRSPSNQVPQLWLVPFFPERAVLGAPASAPPVRLPFQNLAHGNHIAQWTEAIISVN